MSEVGNRVEYAPQPFKVRVTHTPCGKSEIITVTTQNTAAEARQNAFMVFQGTHRFNVMKGKVACSYDAAEDGATYQTEVIVS